MVIEGPTKEHESTDQESLKTYCLNIVYRMIRRALSEVVNPEDKGRAIVIAVEYACAKIAKKVGDNDPEMQTAAKNFISSVSNAQTADDSQIRAIVITNVELIAKSILKRKSIAEIEASIRENFLKERPGRHRRRIELNDLMCFEIDLSDVSEIKLHLLAPFITGPRKIKTLFEDAMNKLATKIQTGELPGISRIVMDSGFVNRNKSLIEPTGFTVKETEKETGKSRAEMNVADFLEKYGN